ncbi:MAG: hypothetical protein JST92_10685 [Deltaproteobacteria bacterium]|nr:hypothetical protein [Deltaproteobacteria bacterium]
MRQGLFSGRWVGALTLSGLLLVGACGTSAPAVIRTSSSPKEPAWLTRPMQEPGYLYFSGTRSGAESLEDGKGAALDIARGEAAKFIGVEISAEHTDVMSTDLASDQVKDTTKSRTQALIKNATLADEYWVKYSRQAGATTIDKFDVSVLIKLSKADLEAEQKRQEGETKAAVNQGIERLHEGDAKEKAGDILGAFVRYRDVVNSLKGLASNVDSGDAMWKNSGQVRQAAQEMMQRAQAKARRVILVGPEWAVGPITQGLSKIGYTASVPPNLTEQDALKQAQSQGILYVVVARATSTPGGPVFNQVAASASLDVRALESQGGATVASSQKTSKGVGRTPDAARAEAAKDAGVGAGAEVANALKAKEDAGM